MPVHRSGTTRRSPLAAVAALLATLALLLALPGAASAADTPPDPATDTTTGAATGTAPGQSADRPADTPVDTPVDTPAGTTPVVTAPGGLPPDTSADTPGVTPPAGTSADTPVGTPPAGTSADTPAGTPIVPPADTPVVTPGVPPAGLPAELPARGSAYMGMGVVAHDGQGARPAGERVTQTEGVDVSGHQGNVNWATLWSSGVKWAYTKATEGNYYKNPSFEQQYNGSYNVGMIRGAYHFGTPNDTSGAVQANYFVDGGGGWSRDGKTLPGVLDIEWNPYGAACYGKTQGQMVDWIRDFLNTYKSRTGRDAVIYTATSWWNECTGNYAGFGRTNPLWIARYDTTVGPLPAGWDTQTIWQYTSTGPTVGDHDRFNGAHDRVVALANG